MDAKMRAFVVAVREWAENGPSYLRDRIVASADALLAEPEDVTPREAAVNFAAAQMAQTIREDRAKAPPAALPSWSELAKRRGFEITVEFSALNRSVHMTLNTPYGRQWYASEDEAKSEFVGMLKVMGR